MSSASMRQRVELMWARWRARPARERALMLTVLVALAVLAGDRIWTGPAWAERKAAGTHAAQTAAALAEARAAMQVLMIEHELHRKQQAAERAQLEHQLEELQARSSVVLSGEAVLSLLETMVVRQEGRVRLVGLTALPDAATAATATAAASAATPVFRHGLQMVVLGRYEALHDYLRALAQEPQLRLAGFQLAVREHPELELTLHIEILSTQAAWLTL